MTRSPWLDIPLADYESHMAHASVGQASFLADVLEWSVEIFEPASIAVIGCAGGNGFDRDRVQKVSRVVGVDINPRYVDAARRRYTAALHGLELYCMNVETDTFEFEPVDLVLAALLFEHVATAPTLRNLRRGCRSGGVIVSVLQLPLESKSSVSPSPYASVQTLASTMKLLSPEELRARAADAGFALESQSTRQLPNGKSFSVQSFRASN